MLEDVRQKTCIASHYSNCLNKEELNSSLSENLNSYNSDFYRLNFLVTSAVTGLARVIELNVQSKRVKR